MIGCIGVLVLNRGDLLLRMVDSIDIEIEKLCIVQNGNDDTVEDAIKKIQQGRNPRISKVYLERPFRNMGVAPAWNSIIKSFPECGYWLIANNDTLFLPGDLEKYHNLSIQNPTSVITDARGSFSCFTISPHIVATVGLFDENIWPIYCEDTEYQLRMKKAGVTQISIPSDLGESNNGSWTIRSNSTYAENNRITHTSNQNYVDAKWGTNTDYQTPWNMFDLVKNSKEINVLRMLSPYNPYMRKHHSEIWNNFENTANRIR